MPCRHKNRVLGLVLSDRCRYDVSLRPSGPLCLSCGLFAAEGPILSGEVRDQSRRRMRAWVIKSGLCDRSASRLPSRLNTGPRWSMAVACFLTSIAASAWVASTDVTVDAAHRRDLATCRRPFTTSSAISFRRRLFWPAACRFRAPAIAGAVQSDARIERGTLCQPIFSWRRAVDRSVSRSGPSVLGQWLAGGLTAFFVFWAGRELAGNRVAFAAGLLTALSPGMAIFCNLLLSHGPTMAALAVFLFCMLRFMRTGRAPRRALGRVWTDLRHALPTHDRGRLRSAVRRLVRVAAPRRASCQLAKTFGPQCGQCPRRSAHPKRAACPTELPPCRAARGRPCRSPPLQPSNHGQRIRLALSALHGRLHTAARVRIQ